MLNATLQHGNNSFSCIFKFVVIMYLTCSLYEDTYLQIYYVRTKLTAINKNGLVGYLENGMHKRAGSKSFL